MDIFSEEDALNNYFNGNSNRIIASHKLNQSSTRYFSFQSRSHCIFTFYLTIEDLENPDQVILVIFALNDSVQNFTWLISQAVRRYLKLNLKEELK